MVVSGTGELLQVLSDVGQQEWRDIDPPNARCRLGRPGDKCPVRQLDYRDFDANEARRQIDVLAAKRGQLALAQATENREQDQQPVATVSERVG